MGILFISHSSRNNAEAMKVRDWLRQQGHGEIFLDLDPVQGLAPGERWQSELKKAGETCAAVIVLISPEWLASDWCRTEFLVAEQLGKRIFPVLIKPTTFDKLPRELVSQFQMADISDPQTEADGFARLGIGLTRAGLDPSSFPWPPPGEPARNPYRGLQALDTEDAAVFFGRDVAITGALDLLRRMRSDSIPKLMVVLGSSGAGKSSFLRAGLLARLANDTENFLPLPPLRPGNAALSGPTGLYHALGGKAACVDDVLARFAAARAQVTERLARYAQATGESGPARPPSIVLPLDQAEEFFSSENAEAEAALKLIAGALNADDNAFAVATIRSDNYSAMQTDPDLSQVPCTLFNLGPMSHANFRAVIEGPARYATPPLKVEPELTERLLGDLDRDDALPLLGFTLERLARLEPASARMTLKGYRDDLGGLTGAIRRAVDQAFANARDDAALPDTLPELLELARAAFIPWLVSLEAADADPRRRVARLDEIPKPAHALVRHLVDRRLLVSATSETAAGELTTIEVAHEAILRRWPELAGWIDAERDFLVGKSRLDQMHADWVLLPEDQRAGGLLTGVLLERARHWLIEHPERFGEGERVFIRRSDEAERVDQARRRRLRLAVTWGSAAAAVFFAFIGGVALWQWDEAAEARAKADAARARAEDALVTAAKSTNDMVARLEGEVRAADLPPRYYRVVLEEVRGLLGGLVKLYPHHAGVRHALEGNLEKLGDLLMAQGETAAARDIFQKGMELARGNEAATAEADETRANVVFIRFQAKLDKVTLAQVRIGPSRRRGTRVIEQTRTLVIEKGRSAQVLRDTVRWVVKPGEEDGEGTSGRSLEGTKRGL